MQMKTNSHSLFVSMLLAAIMAGVGFAGWMQAQAGGLHLPITLNPEGSIMDGKSMPEQTNQWKRVWTWPAGAALSGAPRPLMDGGWVIATDKGRVAALSDDGKMRWSVSFTNLSFVDSPVVAGMNLILVADDGQVLALDAANGKNLWQVPVEGSFRHGPMAMREGDGWQIVLLSSANGVLTALDAKDGHALWHSEPTDRSDGTPATDGKMIAYGNCGSAVHVFDATSGVKVTSIPVGRDAQMAGGALYLNGRVYGGTRSGELVCVNVASNTVAWHAHVAAGEAFSTPVAVGDLVLMGTSAGTVTAFQADDGAEKWKASLSNAVDALCVVDQSVFALSGGALKGLKATDGSVFMSLAVGDRVTAPTANGSRVALADDSGMVIVFGEGF
jgi:outer membrane protein assembly factor BamB